jgi:hypothetical protein
MRLLRSLALTAAATAAIGGAFAAPAAHAASTTAPAPLAGATAPACISRYVTGTVDGFDVLLTNNCGKTMSVRVVVSSAPDSPCYVMSAGSHVLYTYEGIFGNYDRTAVC